VHNGCPGFWPIEKRWREKRNDLAAALTGTSKEIADNILLELGPHKARTVVRALEARLQVVQNPHHDQTRRRLRANASAQWQWLDVPLRKRRYGNYRRTDPYLKT